MGLGFGMNYTFIQQFLSYWDGLRGKGAPPVKELIDLKQILSLLPWVSILELAPDGTVTYRLAGSTFEAAFGTGLKGRTLYSQFADEEEGAFYQRLFSQALVAECGVLINGHARFAAEELSSFSMLALPFRTPESLGCVEYMCVVEPFTYDNHQFLDRFGSIQYFDEEIYLIPQNDLIERDTFDRTVHDMLARKDIALRYLDVQAFLGQETAVKLPFRSASGALPKHLA